MNFIQSLVKDYALNNAPYGYEIDECSVFVYETFADVDITYKCEGTVLYGSDMEKIAADLYALLNPDKCCGDIKTSLGVFKTDKERHYIFKLELSVSVSL